MIFAACHALIFAGAFIAIGVVASELSANRSKIAKAIRGQR